MENANRKGAVGAVLIQLKGDSTATAQITSIAFISFQANYSSHYERLKSSLNSVLIGCYSVT